MFATEIRAEIFIAFKAHTNQKTLGRDDGIGKTAKTSVLPRLVGCRNKTFPFYY